MFEALINGERVKTPSKNFKWEIEGESHLFAIHKSVSYNGLDLSHAASGKRIFHIPHMTIAKHGGDKKAAALERLDELVKHVGPARVRSTLAGA